MSGLDERPIEPYLDEKEQFECGKCHGKITYGRVHYGGTVWWFDYKCLSCGNEGSKIRKEYLEYDEWKRRKGLC